jgi:hypothetical protein
MEAVTGLASRPPLAYVCIFGVKFRIMKNRIPTKSPGHSEMMSPGVPT